MVNEIHHWKQMMNKEYLGWWDLEDGRDVVFTIKEIKEKEIIGENNRRSVKPVAYFKESNAKPMILNVTNCTTIENLYNESNPTYWVGKQIQIYRTTISAKGTKTNCLRIRPYIGFRCSVCNKPVDENLAKNSINAYGAVYCSKECYDNKDKPKNYL